MNANQGASAGALRATSAVLREVLGSHEWFHSNKTLMAEIIDRETGLPELIQALTYVSQVQACGDHARDIQALEACAIIARQALSKGD